MMTATGTISIGRNVGRDGAPMADATWASFFARVVTIARSCGPVYFAGVGDGRYADVEEESATVTFGLDPRDAARVRSALAALCGPFGQECIALTLGQTALVHAGDR